MKMYIFLLVSILLLFFGGQYFIVYLLNKPPESSPEMIAYTEEKVTEFLIAEKGYRKEEILKVESIRGSKSSFSEESPSGYVVQVIFSDEPEEFYNYEIEDNIIYQRGSSRFAEKHKDLDE